jgi:hypothetical protein
MKNFADLRMGFGLGTVQARGACLIWMVLWVSGVWFVHPNFGDQKQALPLLNVSHLTHAL